MAAMRGPDSSQDSVLDANAVVPETVDVNIRQLDPIPAPRYFIKELPLTEQMGKQVLEQRAQIRDILHGRDDRMLAIVGPCSIHDPRPHMNTPPDWPSSPMSSNAICSSSCACTSRNPVPPLAGRA